MALIGLGSDRLYMKIAEKKETDIRILEEPQHPLNLGSDTFTVGKIDFDKVEKICKILNGFKKIAGDYGVKKVRTIGTTALREANNSSYIVDQIAIKTGLKVEILDDSEEKEYIYRQTMRFINDNSRYKNSNILLAYMGTGSLGLAVYKNKKIDFSQNIRIGPLRLTEMLGSLQEKTARFYEIVEEYLSTFTHALLRMVPFDSLNCFFASGTEIKLISELCEAKKDGNLRIIKRKSFDKLYDDLKDKPVFQLAELYSLKEEQAEMLQIAISLYKILMDFMVSEELVFCPSKLGDTILYEDLFHNEKQKMDRIIEDSTILSTRNLGERFSYDGQHARNVEAYSLKIFDSMKQLHGLGSKERLILQIAAILHDVGKFINMKKHAIYSWNIIRSSEIIGINDTEKEMAALIAKHHSGLKPVVPGVDYRDLSQDDRVKVSKLLAVLRISDAIDRAHGNKISDIEVDLKKKWLLILVKTDRDIFLEEWIFQRKATFFQEVFGIKPMLKKVLN